jgi:Protein of unknown function (DUF2442)
MIQVSSVETAPDYGLLLTFNDGSLRRFDMRPYLQLPIFRLLQNPAYFALARVGYGTVTWPDEIDIAPETLFEKSVNVQE